MVRANLFDGGAIADCIRTLAREHTDAWPDTGQLALDQEINALGIAIVGKCLFSPTSTPAP